MEIPVELYQYIISPNIVIQSLLLKKGGKIGFKESNIETMWK